MLAQFPVKLENQSRFNKNIKHKLRLYTVRCMQPFPNGVDAHFNYCALHKNAFKNVISYKIYCHVFHQNPMGG